MEGTSIFATEEEIETLKLMVARGWKPGSPIIATSVMEGILRDEATVDARGACHKLALAHGLPEIPGYYGIDGETREFLRM